MSGVFKSEFSLKIGKNRWFTGGKVAAMHPAKLLLFIKALRYYMLHTCILPAPASPQTRHFCHSPCCSSRRPVRYF